MAKSEHEIVNCIKHNARFYNLAPTVIARLSARTTLLNLKLGTLACRRGELCAGLYIVVRGVITLSVGELHKVNKAIEKIGAGKHAGLAATMLNMPLTATCETRVDSKLLLIPREVFLKCASENYESRSSLIVALGRKICGLIEDIKEFALHSGGKRIALYFLSP